MRILSLRHMLAAGLISLLTAHSAQALTITGGFSGSWYDPATSGQGFNIEVVQGADGLDAVVYWYGFEGGKASWAVGVGSVDGDTVDVRLKRPTGLLKDGFTDVADVTISFEDCDNGTAEVDPADEQVGTGFMDLERITDMAGSDCTGGISDNVSDEAPEIEIKVALENTGVFPDGSGHAKFEQNAHRTDFEVEIEDLPDGIYDLLVAGEFKGSLEIVGGLEAEIEFRSPAEDGKLFLDFDPRGHVIDVELDGIVVLTKLMPTEPPTDEADDDEADDDEVDDDEVDGHEIKVELINTGLEPHAEGEAELEIWPHRIEFEVEVEHLSPGEYDLYVGRVLRGHFPVTDETEWELEFRDPPDDSSLPLDFDVLCQLIEVMQNDAIYLYAEFPCDVVDDSPDDGDDDGSGEDETDDGSGEDEADDEDDDSDDDDSDDDDDDDEDDDDDDDDV